MIYGIPKAAALTMSANGAIRTKRDIVGLPVTLEELVKAAKTAQSAGAALFSFTVRGDKARCSIDPGMCNDVLKTLREETGGALLLQLELDTSSGLQPRDMEAFLRAVNPDAVQLRFDQLFPRDGDENDEAIARDILDLAEEKGLGVQFALVQPSDIDWFYAFRQYGVIPESCRSLLFILGEDGEEPDCDPQDLRRFLNALEKQRLLGQVVWSAAAFGPRETAALTAALALGGHAASGYCYNMLRADGEPFASQQDQLSLLSETAMRLGRPAASAIEARTLLFGPR
ncbi:3-keto-5-aminohexanoate cleavage protein [uncultured Cohaesibacter sp.]|uniref:3-keto-5-aminohexanoate cleavage protein n=1 Tax=uncultured Cohaesibacter sp. TaxID=1002546 RepID=UPI0029C7AF6A|nr:3-keto-5-aminohexanoate cleavage protein [uncultured Cohaesibacter sp.]